MVQKFGLREVPGGIGIDSCASDNVMSKSHLSGYRVQPSEGSKRGQRWGSASGHSIRNEGQVNYTFMTETGNVARGHTQVGEVKRPLAAVSKISEAGNIALFAEGDNWIINRKDDLAEEILELVRRAKKKTMIHKHKGTYRMRAWLIPEGGGRPLEVMAALLAGREHKQREGEAASHKSPRQN